MLDCGCVDLQNYERAAFVPTIMLHAQHKHTGSNLFNFPWASLRVGRPLPLLEPLLASLHRLPVYTAPRLGFMAVSSRRTKSAQEHQRHDYRWKAIAGFVSKSGSDKLLAYR